MRYAPSRVVTTLRATFVAGIVATTTMSGSGLPSGPVTVPSIAPVVSCAQAAPHGSTSAAKRTSRAQRIAGEAKRRDRCSDALGMTASPLPSRNPADRLR